MNEQTLQSTLGAMRNTGSIFGVMLLRENETLFLDAPFSVDRIAEVTATLDDIAYYFDNEGRAPDQLAFGYDGGNLLIFLEGALRLVVLYHQPGEVDLVATAAKAFLKDFQLSEIAGKFAERGLAAAISGHRPVSPTEPIAPVAS